jgi:parallel beta-helix repeat protein
VGNNISQNGGGISLFQSNENNISGNLATYNSNEGVNLQSSIENNIIGNNVLYNVWGFDVLLSHRNNIENNTVSWNNYEGIYCRRSNGNRIIGNIISSNKYVGIFIKDGSCYTVINNSMNENSIFISGILLEHYNTHEIDTSNTVGGKQVYYWKNRTGGVIPFGAGEVILANCSNVKIKNQDISLGTVGIELGYSSNNVIKFNNATSNNLYGIYLDHSSNNSLTGNNVSLNRLGIGLLDDSNQNDITYNYISSSEKIGIYLRESISNNIFHNNFIQNTQQAYDETNFKNVWDCGYPSGGNYWSDYEGPDNFSGPGQNISGSDGIGDDPYLIDLDSMDNYPILAMVEEDDPPLPPPVLYIEISQDGKDVILNWDPFPVEDDPYLIYRSTDPTEFDFDRPWVNTKTDIEYSEFESVPDRTTWTDKNAANPENETNYQERYYYTIRAFIDGGEVSRTSRTVGKWTKTFPKGVSTFSLPLEPIDTLYTDDLTTDMKADYIKYMDPANHTWRQHNLGDGGINNTQMKLGEGYEVKFHSQKSYTFCGMPAVMISYDDYSGFSGFDTTNEARSLDVFVEEDGDVRLSWEEPGSMNFGNRYEVYCSSSRDGFYGGLNSDYFPVCSPIYFGNNTAIHMNALANNPGTQLYYMVVPFNASDIRGSSTYSIGIWTEEYLKGYDTFGLPLKLDCNPTADCFCDRIPNTVGINYYDKSSQRWSWHSKRMPEGAYDPVLEMSEGYQISTFDVTKITFIGT